MPGRRAGVWYGDQRVGRLQEDDQHQLLFAYDADWLNGDGFPVSLSLPLSCGDAWVDGSDFFGGLLPEGAARRRICQRLGIDVEDDTGLLFAIGADCAGALSVLPEGREPPDTKVSEPLQPLPERELDSVLRSAGHNAARLTGEARRFSLAGAQDKLPVILDDHDFFLPDHARPSTHILKFETYPRVCLAEYMGSEIARRCGLAVVETGFEQLNDSPYLLIVRYDRDVDSEGCVRRLHQEDMMQALAMPSMLKYQREGGPNIGQIAELLRRHADRPAQAIARLRDWQILNVLMGNWDGHAKNLAFCYRPGSTVPQFAPFYDLVSIEFLNQAGRGDFSRDMALAVGSSFTPERIGRADWVQFARDLGVPPRPLLQRVQTLAESVEGHLQAARGEFADRWGDDGVLDVFERTVRKRCRWVLEQGS